MKYVTLITELVDDVPYSLFLRLCFFLRNIFFCSNMNFFYIDLGFSQIYIIKFSMNLEKLTFHYFVSFPTNLETLTFHYRYYTLRFQDSGWGKCPDIVLQQCYVKLFIFLEIKEVAAVKTVNSNKKIIKNVHQWNESDICFLRVFWYWYLNLMWSDMMEYFNKDLKTKNIKGICIKSDSDR